MLAMRMSISGFAIAFAVVGIVVLYRQSKATSCPLHNHFAGKAAVSLAYFSLALCAASLAYAWMGL